MARGTGRVADGLRRTPGTPASRAVRGDLALGDHVPGVHHDHRRVPPRGPARWGRPPLGAWTRPVPHRAGNGLGAHRRPGRRVVTPGVARLDAVRMDDAPE